MRVTGQLRFRCDVSDAICWERGRARIAQSPAVVIGTPTENCRDVIVIHDAVGQRAEVRTAAKLSRGVARERAIVESPTEDAATTPREVTRNCAGVQPTRIRPTAVVIRRVFGKGTTVQRAFLSPTAVVSRSISGEGAIVQRAVRSTAALASRGITCQRAVGKGTGHCAATNERAIAAQRTMAQRTSKDAAS